MLTTTGAGLETVRRLGLSVVSCALLSCCFSYRVGVCFGLQTIIQSKYGEEPDEGKDVNHVTSVQSSYYEHRVRLPR
ncbi:uncharacterized protein BDV14DRAFT_35308 [Aspergillus stella-maris]|uniref:uncharacterized protein n=1 Tax=Aspergillus stella-maris TaxID=1810926 RepID=UPI003CCE3E63